MQYILDEKEYNELKHIRDEEHEKWIQRAHNLFSMLVIAKNYPCINYSYCDKCELEDNVTCYKTRMYGK